MFKQLKKTLTRLHSDDTGAMSVEKVLILAVIALPILIILYLFKQRIVTWFTGQADQLQDPGTGNLP
jgi:Flp pilus assembly pilin Flp